MYVCMSLDSYTQSKPVKINSSEEKKSNSKLDKPFLLTEITGCVGRELVINAENRIGASSSNSDRVCSVHLHEEKVQNPTSSSEELNIWAE